MNRPTIINTIKKAAPLALLAVVMSGSALAGPPDKAGKPDKGGRPDKGGYGSIEVTNDCSLDPKTKEFVVHSTIEDASDDRADVYAQVDTITVTAKQKGDKGPWGYLGSPDEDQAYVGPNTATFPLCTGLADGATALNAEIDVVLLNGSKGKTTLSSKCDDDPDTKCSYWDYDLNKEVVYYCEEKDESTINVPADFCTS
jgi:hypothetical protein